MLIFYLVAGMVLTAAAFGAARFGRRHAYTLQRQRRFRIDRFKLKKRHADIRLEVFGSPEVVEAIKAYAKEHHVPTDAALRQAQIYLAEILPKFNVLAYYRIGAPLARTLLYLMYRVVVERRVVQEFNRTAPKNSTVVYVINHRSNADYVLVAHMLFKFISLSYAVGEWARVWPLNHIFKWFGAYFIRRRYREPLYHAVLRRFVQTITKNGVTQGIFLEGGLSRSGLLQKPKLGMLDYLITAKRDRDFDSPLYFFPTALNFDRVLEDRNLTEELLGKEDRRTRWEKGKGTAEFLFKNFFRSLARRFKRYGLAVVAFGEPLCVDDWIREHPEILAEPFEARKAELQKLADEIMRRISGAIPATPVAVVATVMRNAARPLPEDELLTAIASTVRGIGHRGWAIGDRTAADVWRMARDVLSLRHLIVEREGEWSWAPGEELLMSYYANSLVPYSSAEC